MKRKLEKLRNSLFSTKRTRHFSIKRQMRKLQKQLEKKQKSQLRKHYHEKLQALSKDIYSDQQAWRHLTKFWELNRLLTKNPRL